METGRLWCLLLAQLRQDDCVYGTIKVQFIRSSTGVEDGGRVVVLGWIASLWNWIWSCNLGFVVGLGKLREAVASWVETFKEWSGR